MTTLKAIKRSCIEYNKARDCFTTALKNSNLWNTYFAVIDIYIRGIRLYSKEKSIIHQTTNFPNFSIHTVIDI